MMLLIALGDDARPVQTGLAAGLSAWGMSVQNAPPEEDAGTDGFAVVESISLLHIAAEAIVRVFLAHVNRPNCPPLELASLTNFRDFKKQAKAILDDPPGLEVLRDLFRGTVESPEGVSEEEWAEDGEVLRFLLFRAADLLLNHAHVYNSTKHGLAVLPRHSSLRLGAVEDPMGIVIDHSGSSVRYLSRESRAAEGGEAWSEIVQFEFPSINLALASGFTRELEALHSVAAARFRNEKVRVFIQERALIDYVQNVPFGSEYTGLLSLSMKRSFTVNAQDDL